MIPPPRLADIFGESTVSVDAFILTREFGRIICSNEESEKCEWTSAKSEVKFRGGKSRGKR